MRFGICHYVTATPVMKFQVLGYKITKKTFAYEQMYLLRELMNYVNTYGTVVHEGTKSKI